MKLTRYKLSKLIHVSRGASLPGTGYADEGRYLRLTLANFKEEGGFKEFKSTEGKFFTGDFKEKFLMKRGDLITPLTEQCPGLLGSVAFIPCDDLYIQSQDVGLIECDEAKINKRFAYYLFLTKSVREQIAAKSQQTKIRHTSPEKIEDVTVDIPDRSDQLRIAGLLGSLDEKITICRKKIAELEALAKLVYERWFVEFEFPNADGRPYKSNGGKMVWNETLKRNVPEGWSVRMLPEIADYLFGFPFDSAKFNSNGIGTSIVRIRNVKDGFTSDFTTEVAPDEYYIDNGDFIIGMDGYFDMNLWIGGKAYLVQRSCRVTAKNPIHQGYLIRALYLPIKHLEQSLTGATLAHLGKAHLDRIPILLPPEDVSAFHFLNEIDARKVQAGIEIRRLSEFRDWLLPMLMNGQVEVRA